jgi:hypothetical protein
VRVEGGGNTRWLILRLSQSFVFKTSAPICDEETRACCVFDVPHGSFISRAGLERLLGAIPEVSMMNDPA